MRTDYCEKQDQTQKERCFATSPPPLSPITQLEARPAAGGRDAWPHWIESDPVVTTSGGGGGVRVLFICYQFPPIGGSGAQRPAKLVKYLDAAGFDIEVLTAAHQRFPWIDPSLCSDVPAAARIHRVAGNEPACLAKRFTDTLAGCWRCVCTDADRFPKQWIEDRIYWRLARWAQRAGLGNGEPLWIGSAARTALALHHRQPFDVIVSTGPPHFVHRVALRVCAETRLPWVADVRDPFVSDFDPGRPDSRHLAAMRRLERAILRRASRIVTTSAALAADFRARFPRRRASDIRTITNGFDRDDLRTSSDGFDGDARTGKGEECTFVAAGAFYGRRELRRVVEPIGRALARHPEWCGRVRLVVAGTLDAQQQDYWRKERPAWMHLAGYLDHASAIRLVVRSACSVMIVPDCCHSRTGIPGKTFELIALPTHVLALVPPGSEPERIVARAGAATIAPFEDSAKVTAAVESVIERHLSETLPRDRTWSHLDRYDRCRLAVDFGGCLHDAIRRGRT